MAIEAVPYAIEYVWRDREGTPARTNMHIQNRPVLAANVLTKAAAMVPLLRALSSCHLVGYRVISRYQDPAVAGAGEVERRGRFVFVTGQGTTYTTTVPGFKDSLVDANGRDITVKGSGILAPVATFIDKITDGPAGWANGPVNEAGIDLVAARSGKKIHIRSSSIRSGRSG